LQEKNAKLARIAKNRRRAQKTFASISVRLCKSGGKSFADVEWNENNWCNFTSNVKSFGVAAHQRSTILGSGTE
jgi:hypothetical protein